MNALILGATGATGKDLLQLMLQDEEVKQVTIFARRKVDIVHPKLQVHIIDFDQPEQWQHLVTGDVLFSSLGTTLKAAGSKAAQWKIDYDYQFQFAEAAKKNGIASYVLVSSSNASANSFIFYSKMKGQLEEAVTALCFPCLAIFNPPILVRKESDRTGEVVAIKVFRFFNKLGMLRSQAPLQTDILAKAMLLIAKKQLPGITIIDNQKISDFVATEA
jgi:uncharacterized protein YbjT (DUF2867 family)